MRTKAALITQCYHECGCELLFLEHHNLDRCLLGINTHRSHYRSFLRMKDLAIEPRQPLDKRRNRHTQGFSVRLGRVQNMCLSILCGIHKQYPWVLTKKTWFFREKMQGILKTYSIMFCSESFCMDHLKNLCKLEMSTDQGWEYAIRVPLG